MGHVYLSLDTDTEYRTTEPAICKSASASTISPAYLPLPLPSSLAYKYHYTSLRVLISYDVLSYLPTPHSITPLIMSRWMSSARTCPGRARIPLNTV